MKTLQELRVALGKAVDELNSEEVISDAAKYAAKKKEVDEIQDTIKRTTEAQALSASLAKPARGAGAGNLDNALRAEMQEGLSKASGIILPPEFMRSRRVNATVMERYYHTLSHVRSEMGMQRLDPQVHFRTLGEQLQAIQQFAATRGSVSDPRLVRAPTGAGEVDPTGGGFLVQIDFATTIFMLAHDMGEILSRVPTIPISSNSNGLKIPGVDETSRATGSRWGGVSSQWVDEGTGATASKPKFRMVEFDLKKLIATMYTSDELLQDAAALTAIASQAFSEEIMFMVEDAIVEGTGAGQPLGILNCNAKVSVAKQTGQAAATIVKENIDNMWTRMWARSRMDAAWFINQDCEPQLASLNQAVGTGGQLVYLPPGGLSGLPFSTLYGKPVIATEYNSALGTEGDIMLLDLGQYRLVDKNGVQAATSMHVAFLTDQSVFRVTYRVDGRPMWHSALTPFKGSATKSPFITLATRQ